MFTPRTPRLVFAAILATTLLSSFNTMAQTTESLQKLEKYEASLKEWHNRRFAADRKEFLETTKKKWWYYLPNAGITLGMPTISTNTGTLAQIDRDRQTKKAKLEALQAQAEFQFRDELLQLRAKYKILVNEIASLQRKAKALDKRTQITKTYQEGYESLKVTPLEMMQQELTQTTAENQLAEEYSIIDRKIVELETFAHYLFPVMAQLIEMEEMDCEMKNLPNPTMRPK